MDAFAEQQADVVARRPRRLGHRARAARGRCARRSTSPIYTPGSSAGRRSTSSASLAAPPGDTDPEVVSDEIDGYVTSLLGMLGISGDPLSSREHILLANLIQNAWSQGQSLDLGTLLAQVQQPPMRKLGVLELDAFFPPNDRMAFAMKLNGLLASPSFAAWLTGDPIDIDAMLRTPDGTPALRDRHDRAPRRRAAPVGHLARALEARDVDAPAERHERPARAALHGRGRGLPPADGEPADEEADHAAAQAGARLRPRRGALDPEPGRRRLQGAVERRHLAHRPAADRAGQGPARRRPLERGRRRRHQGRQRHDQQPGQAPVPAQARGQGRARGDDHALGDELPARSAHARPDRPGDGARGCAAPLRPPAPAARTRQRPPRLPLRRSRVARPSPPPPEPVVAPPPASRLRPPPRRPLRRRPSSVHLAAGDRRRRRDARDAAVAAGVPVAYVDPAAPWLPRRWAACPAASTCAPPPSRAST